jgi:hypothetical protein
MAADAMTKAVESESTRLIFVVMFFSFVFQYLAMLLMKLHEACVTGTVRADPWFSHLAAFPSEDDYFGLWRGLRRKILASSFSS